MKKTIRQKREETDIQNIARASMDKYSTDLEYDPNLYQRVIHTNLLYSPKEGETFRAYIQRVKIHRDILTKSNTLTHIETARGRPWHTHIRPDCFMCNDRNFYTVLTSVLEYLSIKYPKLTL